MHSTPQLLRRFVVLLLYFITYHSLTGQDIALAEFRPMYDRGTGVPRCEVPKGIQVKTTDYGLALKFNRQLSWDAYRLEIKVTGPVIKDGAVVSRVQYYDYGKEGYFPELVPGENYTVYARRLCGGMGQTYETTSDWVDLGRYSIKSSSSKSRGNLDCGLAQQGLGVAVSQVSDVWCTLQINGPTPVPQGTRYQLMIKEVNGSAGSDKLYYVMESNTYRAELLTPLTTYDVYIRAISGGEFTEFTDACEYFKALTFTTLAPGANPENSGSGTGPQCGSTAGNIDLTPNPVSSLRVGDFFLVNGFPLKIATVTGTPAGWSGTGTLLVPFGQKNMQVTFTNVQVNIFRNLYSGTVNSVRMPVANIPYLNLPALNIGGDICIPAANVDGWLPDGTHKDTGQPWNPKGFGQDGKYRKVPPYPGWEPGDPTDSIYDPYGFDANGNHRSGGRYDECGCDVNGLNQDGNDCDRSCQQIYSWLQKDSTNTRGVTEDGSLFAKQLGDTIKLLMIQSLQELKAANGTVLQLRRDTCNLIRNDINAAVVALGYPREMLFLQNDAAFNEGMHKLFVSEPSQLIPNVTGRPPQQDVLEKKHAELYGCDVKLQFFKNVDSVLLKIQTGIDQYEKDAIEWVKRFKPEEVEKCLNRDTLKFWIKNWIKIRANNLYYDLYQDFGLGAVEVHKQQDMPLNVHYYSEVADSRAGFEGLKPAFTRIQYQGFEKVVGTVALQEALDQGWEKIYGIDRAFFIQAIADAKAALVPFNAQDGEMAPLNIKKEVLGRNYNMYLDNFVFTPNSATCNVHFILEIPNSGNQIAFTLTGTTIQVGGFAQEKIRLALATNVNIRISNAMRMTLEGNTNPLLATAVDFDCKGFAGMQLVSMVEVCRDYLIPVANGQELPDPQRVKGKVEAYIAGWNDLLVSINITPFKVNKVNNIAWNVQQFTLDFSDTRSPNVTFPLGYTSELAVNGVPSPLWKGMYVQSLGAELSSSFSKNGEKTAINFNNVVFDDTGLSGYCEVKSSLLSLENGSIGGWAMSINFITIKLLSNAVASFGMGGQVKVPLFNTPLGYTAYFDPDGDYKFSVIANDGPIKADVLFADVTLDDNSRVNISKSNGQWLTQATLNGSMTIGKPDTRLAIEGVKFTNLQLSNQQPYINIGTWQFGGGYKQELAGFSMVMQSPVIDQESEDRVRVGLGLSVSLGNETAGIKTRGGISIYGKLLINSSGQHQWVNDGFGLDSLSVSGDLAGCSIDGSLYFFKQDPVYGDGFQGILSAKFPKISLGSLDAVAQFGAVNNAVGVKYKYFMVDAMISLPKGIPVGGAIAIKGFGGGVSNRMKRQGSGSMPGSNNTARPGRPPIGTSLSGSTYVPNDTMGLGFKALAQLVSSTNEKIFSANVALEFVFNGSGGINSIAFTGRGQMLTTIDVDIPVEIGTGRATPASICGYVKLEYDFQNEVFDGNFGVDIQTPANFLTANGEAKIHANFKSGLWYIYVGTPQAPLRAAVSLFGSGAGIQATAYFCVGNKVPDIPPLPPDVASLTGVVGGVPNSMRSNGRGIIFGAAFSAGTGPKTVLNFLFYEFEVGLGADVMLKQYPGLICAHNNQEIGIDGWYATGQAWAKVRGAIGIKTKVFGKRIEATIADLAAAAAIQVRLPNPFYAEGGVGGRYNILGGLVKGSFKFKFELGKTCKPAGGSQGGSQEDIPEIVQLITPMDGTTDVELDVVPKVEFSLPLEKPFPCQENADGSKIDCTVKLKSVKLKSSRFGTDMPVTQQYNADKTALDLKPMWFLYSDDTLDLSVQVAIMKNGQEYKTETKASRFYTGPMIDILPLSNIAATYPAIGQYNFYKNEYKPGTGFVQLEQGQGELFAEYPTSNFAYKVKFASPEGQSFETTFKYLDDEGKIEYQMPADKIQNNTYYSISFVIAQKPRNKPSIFDFAEAFQTASENPSGGSAAGSRLASAQGAGETLVSKEILSYYFRASHYNTFLEKMTAAMASATKELGDYSVGYTLNINEKFDPFELDGVNGSEPAISMLAEIQNSTWYKENLIYEHLYSMYPEPKEETFREMMYNLNYTPGTSSAVFPPNDEVHIRNDGGSSRGMNVNGKSFSSNTEATFTGSQKLVFAVPSMIKEHLGKFTWDLRELFSENKDRFCACKDQYNAPKPNDPRCTQPFGEDAYCIKTAFGGPHYTTAPKYIKVYTNSYSIPPMFNGEYLVDVVYKLPGTNIVSTLTKIKIVK